MSRTSFTTFAMVRYPWMVSAIGDELTSFTELGILVWQDFMFGCGQVNGDHCIGVELRCAHDGAQYPAYESFTKSVEIEAEQNVKRLRHHPSIVIFGEQSTP